MYIVSHVDPRLRLYSYTSTKHAKNATGISRIISFDDQDQDRRLEKWRPRPTQVKWCCIHAEIHQRLGFMRGSIASYI